MRKLLLISLVFIQVSCDAQNEKINGISFVGGRNEVNASHVKSVVNVNANWACIMPFGFMRTPDTTEIRYNMAGQWWGERRVGAKKTTQFFQAEGIKVMIKPQIWIWRGEFTGIIEMKTEEGWKAFEGNYEKFILEYADMAREVNADIFCIGTELNTFVNARPQFWEQLITKIKKIYKGKLTYAENWDTFDKVPFWDKLDYVGVDAYFPLCENQTPTLETLRLGWKNHKPKIAALQQQQQKPVLFTEYGYRSVDYSGKRPWDFSREMNAVNLAAQENGLKAIYEEFWKEDWFAGGFLWKWYDNHDRAGGTDNSRFTPQNKPAEELVRKFYGGGTY